MPVPASSAIARPVVVHREMRVEGQGLLLRSVLCGRSGRTSGMRRSAEQARSRICWVARQAAIPLRPWTDRSDVVDPFADSEPCVACSNTCEFLPM